MGHHGEREHKHKHKKRHEGRRDSSTASSASFCSASELIPMSDVELNKVYKGLIYGSHDTHGFFIYFGSIDSSGRFNRFESHGRLARAGLPPKYARQCDRLKTSERAADLDDLVDVKVVKASYDEMRKKHFIELALLPTRKLLILDLNGVLLKRYPPGDPRRHSNSYLKRTACDDFIDFCFKKFDVGIWSCSRRQSIEIDLFNRYTDEIMFVNDQTHSLNKWPRHSVVSEAKPLFIKDLKALWRQLPIAYDEHNTILLDNHVEKFEGNPLGTCVLVPEFDGIHEDDVLTLDGALVRHLRRIAKHASSSLYILGVESDLFPKAYPEPPEKQDMGLQQSFLDAFCGAAYMRTHMPAFNVNFYMDKNDTPGPRAIPLRRKTVPALLQRDFLVCEKSDGTRNFLYVHEGKAYFVERNWHFRPISDKIASHLSPHGGTTILDGELIDLKGAQAGQQAFLIFDSAFIDGKDIGSIPSYEERMKLLADALGDDPSLAMQDEQQPPIIFSIKGMYPLARLADVAGLILPDPSSRHSHLFNDGKRESACDGLVFTPALESYFAYMVFKFKFAELITIDFEVSAADLQKASGEGKVPAKLDSANMPITHIFIPSQQALQLSDLWQANHKTSGILECSFNKEQGSWTYKTHRTDKAKPNSLVTAWSNLESVAEDMTLTDLQRALDVEKAKMFSTDPPSEGMDAVAIHYDSIQLTRKTQPDQLDPRIHGLRRLNNWAKAVLFNLFTSGSIPPSTPSPSVSPRPNPLSQGPPTSGGRPKRRLQVDNQPLSVLELACGRGGDVKKWAIAGATEYVGIDISAQSVAECLKRLEETKKKQGFPHNFAVLVDSMMSSELPARIRRVAPWIDSFDVVSIQFALHYACENEANLISLFQNIHQLLRPGGSLLVSTMDPRALDWHIRQEGRQFGNSIYRVAFDDQGPIPAVTEALGFKYKFTLSSAVQECEEYSVHLSTLAKVAGDYAMDLKMAINLGEFVAQHMGSYGDLMDVTGVGRVSEEEWEAIQLYALMVFDRRC